MPRRAARKPFRTHSCLINADASAQDARDAENPLLLTWEDADAIAQANAAKSELRRQRRILTITGERMMAGSKVRVVGEESSAKPTEVPRSAEQLLTATPPADVKLLPGTAGDEHGDYP
mmetsp:Transcript_111839/g.323231  ORF Transcript_111839/g.323231 Transcript_111839/m.323231 type:complete len:119 (+) Transcript_111839:3-359(+)